MGERMLASVLADSRGFIRDYVTYPHGVCPHIVMQLSGVPWCLYRLHCSLHKETVPILVDRLARERGYSITMLLPHAIKAAIRKLCDNCGCLTWDLSETLPRKSIVKVLPGGKK